MIYLSIINLSQIIFKRVIHLVNQLNWVKFVNQPTQECVVGSIPTYMTRFMMNGGIQLSLYIIIIFYYLPM